MRLTSHHARRAKRSPRTRLLEALEDRRLMCVMHLDETQVRFEPGTPETWASDRLADTALHGYDREAARASESAEAAFDIVWTNRGSDGFGVFGANAAAARAVVDAAIFDWEQRIVNVNQVSGNNRINVSISMESSGTGFGGAAGSYTYDSSGRPTSGAITILRGNDTNSDGNGDGAGWFIDPSPLDSSEFRGWVDNAYSIDANTGSPAAGLSDLYTLVSVEMVHVLGISSNSSSRYNTNQLWDVVNTADNAEGGGVGRYARFIGPSVRHLMTTNNGGASGSDAGRPLHGAGPTASIILGGTTWTGANDSMNASFEGSRRYLPSRVASLIMKDALGYTIAPIEQFENGYINLNRSTGNLLIRGGESHRTGSSFSTDTVTLEMVGGVFRVSVDVSNDMPGTLDQPGPASLPAWVSEFDPSEITSIVINTWGSNDNIIVKGIPHSASLTINADSGNDTITIGDAAADTWGFGASVVINAGIGNDTVTLNKTGYNWDVTINGDEGDDTFNTGNGDFDTFIAGTVTINGGAGTNVLNLNDTDDTPGNDTYFINKTTFNKVTGRTLTYAGLSNFNLWTTDYSEVLNVQGVPQNLTMIVRSYGGNDQFVVGNGRIDENIDGKLEIWTGSGNDKVTLDDSQHWGSDTYTVSGNQLSKSFLADSISFLEAELWELKANTFPNTINVGIIYNTQSATVRGGGGDDVIRVGSPQNDLDFVQGTLYIDGQTGIDTVVLNDSGDVAGPDVYSLRRELMTDIFSKTQTAETRMVGHEKIEFTANGGNNPISINPTVVPVLLNAGPGDDNINVEGSNVTVVSGTGNDSLSIDGDMTDTGAHAVIAGSEHLRDLFVGPGGRLTLQSGGTTTLDVSRYFTVMGVLDVTDSRMIHRDTSASTATHLQGILATGRNGGAWNATSAALVSSVAASATHANDAVGITTGAISGLSTFGGVAIGANDHLIGYTILGDTDLDRTVGFADLLRLAQNYGQSPRIWGQGDFDHNGEVQFGDLLILAQNYEATLLGSSDVAPARSVRRDRLAELA